MSWMEGFGKTLYLSIANVPTAVGFAVTDYVAGMVISAVPMVGAFGGLEINFLRGMIKVVDYSTWEGFGVKTVDPKDAWGWTGKLWPTTTKA